MPLSKSARSALAGVLAVAAVLAVGAVVPASADPVPAIRGAGSRSAIPGSYLVKLKDTAPVRAAGIGARAQALSNGHHGKVGHLWNSAMHGFSVTMSEQDARKLAADPDVAYVEQDQRVVASAHHTTPTAMPSVVQTPVSWGLDRIDQHALPLDNHYSYDDSAGQGVHVYLLSGGIQASTPDLGGRVSYGPNFIGDGQPNSEDCLGIGTEEAGIIGGTQYGVAKKVNLVGVRIYGCNGISSRTSIVDGFDWVVSNAIKPAVIQFDLADLCFLEDGSTVPCEPAVAQTYIDAQEAAFAAGIATVTGAGDSAINTCGRSSGAAPDSLYVGATGINDARAGSSNFGPCLTMWAPGEGITTDSPTGAVVDSGSFLASAHVAGAVALFLGKPEFAGASPGQIRDELVKNRSTPDVVTGLGAGSPNRLLFTGQAGLFNTGSSLGLVSNGDGRLEFAGVTKAGFLQVSAQTSVGSNSWSNWTQSATKGWQSVGAGANADGRIQLAGLTTAGDVWQRAQTTVNANAWSSWTSLNRPPNPAPLARAVVAHNHSNRVQIFATNDVGQAFTRAQISPGSTTWSGWSQFSVGKLRSIAAVANADGRIEFLGLDDAGAVSRSAQTSATDNNWSGFTKLNGFAMAAIAATQNSNGTLELVGIDTGGGGWRRAQASAGSTSWTDWSPLPTKTLADIAAETDTNGQVHLVGVDNLGNIWQSTQTSANASSYNTWTSISGQLRP